MKNYRRTRRAIQRFAVVPLLALCLGAAGPQAGGERSVVAFGADPTGSRDSAPAFRAAIASDQKIIVPPGTYLFASTQTAPCCAFDRPAVLVQGLSNFEIDGHDAIIKIADNIAFSSAFQFDQDKNFVVRGLTIQGTRTGLSAKQENVGITASSDMDFTIEDIRFAGNFGGVGAAVAGDWMVNGTFRRLRMDAVGHCFDVAYLKHVRVDSVRAQGTDQNGNHGPGQVGQTCFSIIVDPPNAANNKTGVAFNQTDWVEVTGLDESNFDTGGLIETGTHYRFSGNTWHDNPGHGSAAGLGLFIRYNPATSTGAPPRDISIADHFANNGAAVAGYGVLISSAGISNDDTISRITVSGSQFDHTGKVAVGSDSPRHLSDIVVRGAAVGQNLRSIAKADHRADSR